MVLTRLAATLWYAAPETRFAELKNWHEARGRHNVRRLWLMGAFLTLAAAGPLQAQVSLTKLSATSQKTTTKASTIQQVPVSSMIPRLNLNQALSNSLSASKSFTLGSMIPHFPLLNPRAPVQVGTSQIPSQYFGQYYLMKK